MKTLKPGPRPFIALGTMFGLMFLMPLYVGINTGKWAAAGKMAGGILALAAFVLGPLAFTLVEVDDEEIRLKKFGLIWKRARFEDIGWSISSALAEKDWPLDLTIIGQDGESTLMSIRLKCFRKEDVAWLLTLSKLKIR